MDLPAIPPRLKQWHTPLLIFAFCVAMGVLATLDRYFLLHLRGQPVTWRTAAWEGGDWIAVGLLMPIAYYLAVYFPIARATVARRVPLHLAGVATFTVAWAALRLFITGRMHVLGDMGYGSWILATLPDALFTYFGLAAALHAYTYFIDSQRRQSEATQLRSQLADARLSALRMQLHPHFLFNTLNAILVLIRDNDSAAAGRMLELLAALLRHVLVVKPADEVSLAEELRFLQEYLAIEQVRFSGRLLVDWAIETPARDALVPVFLLQPLVENAIRHGIAPVAQGGTLTISAHRVNGSLALAVRDNGAGFKHDYREGIGLRNTRERLQTLYGGRAALSIQTQPAAGTEIALTLPFRTQNG